MSKINVIQGLGMFPHATFKDKYNSDCIIKISSIIDDRCIWFGLEKAEPRILAYDAKRLGIETGEEKGWVDYPFPKEVSISCRMHLNMQQVKDLLPILQKFAETGEIS